MQIKRWRCRSFRRWMTAFSWWRPSLTMVTITHFKAPLIHKRAISILWCSIYMVFQHWLCHLCVCLFILSFLLYCGWRSSVLLFSFAQWWTIRTITSSGSNCGLKTTWEPSIPRPAAISCRLRVCAFFVHTIHGFIFRTQTPPHSTQTWSSCRIYIKKIREIYIRNFQRQSV